MAGKTSMDRIEHHSNGIWKLLFLLLTFMVSSKNYALSKEIKITIIDSESGAKIPNTAIEIYVFGHSDFITNSDSLGCIFFNLPDSVKDPICISATHPLYIYKHFCFRSERLRDFYTIPLRNKVHSSVDLTTIDSAWIGLKMQKAIRKFKLNDGDYAVIDEPPGILRGIYFQTGNGGTIALFIARTVCNRDDPKYKNEKIIGVAVFDADCTYKQYHGKGMPWIGIPGYNCN